MPVPDTLPTPKELADSTALIVGGTSGVGLETARQLRGAGVRRIVIVGRDSARGQRALAAVGRDGDVTFVAGDANDPGEAMRIAQAAADRLGPIDILVNATAPNVLPDLFQNLPVAEIAHILTQLALAPMHMTGAVLPLMRAQRSGVIVNIASDAAKSPTPGEAVIGAAMAAIVMFSRTIAMEAKRDGIRVNVLTPSLIAGTETSERILKGGFSAKLFQKAASMAHLGVATPADVASLIVYLASHQAARLTGQAISVNGGISA